MAGGIVAGRYLPGGVGAWGVCGAAAVIVAVASLRRRHLRLLTIAAVAVGVFCLAALTGALAYNHVPANHVVTFSEDGSLLATIRGRIITAPQIRQSPTAFWEPPKTSFLLSASAIRRTDGQWLDAQGLVRVTVAEPMYDLPSGRKVELVGTLSRPRPPGNPGQYDWQRSDRYRGIHVKFHVPGEEGVLRLPDQDNWLVRKLWELRTAVRRHVTSSGERDDALLLEALVLGDRDPALENLNRAMVEAGTAHMLSISGQHMAIFLGFVYLVFRMLTFPPRRSAAITLATLVLYVSLTELNAPLLRSAVMAGALCVAGVSGRTVTPINALAGAAVVLLLLDPLQLFRAEFQLSFGIVTGIILLHAPLRELLFGRWLRRRGLVVLRGRARLRRWLYFRAAEWGIGLVCLSLAAYLTSVPLVAYHFGLFSPYASVLSVLLSPLMTLVLVPAYVSMALAWPMPNLSAGLAHAAAGASGWMRQASLALQRLPGLSFDLYAVPGWLVALFYLAVALWVLAPRRRAIFAAAGLATAGVVVATVFTQLPAAAPAAPVLHVLDVAHGSMALVHAPDGQTYLLDAGTLGSMNVYHQVLRPFLRAKRLPSPQTVFISHANIDHYNALPDLLGRRPPRRVYVNDYFGLDPEAEVQAATLLKTMARRNVQIVRLRRGQSVPIGGDSAIEVLWPGGPDETVGLNVNDASLVLRISGAGRSAIVPGDVGVPAEMQLARLPRDKIRCDVLVLPHHGSLTPTLGLLIAAADPQVLVQSNSFRQSPQQLLQAIGGRARYATFQDGWTALTFAPDGVTVETMRGRQPADK